MLRKLFITRIAVKSTNPHDPNTTWFVQRETPIESFIDDWFRYGFKIAWHNFKWIMQERKTDERLDV